MFFEQLDEVGGGIARERRLSEMRIPGDEILGGGMKIGEVAATAARDEDFLADAVSALEEQDSFAAFTRLNRAHQAGGAGSENDGVVCLIHAG